MYGKIFERVFTGSMFGSGPVVFSVWAYVIANTKPPGVVELNPRLLAACIGTSTEEVKGAIEFLCRPDPESHNADERGCRLVHTVGNEYHVVSFDKYRKMQSAEDRREYHREYWHRRKHSTPLNNTQHHSSNSTEAEAEAEAEEKEKDGAEAPDVWGFGIEVLTKESGLSTSSARSYLGALLKSWNEATVLDALMAATGKGDPKAYARKWLEDKPKKGQQRKSAAQELMEEMNASQRPS